MITDRARQAYAPPKWLTDKLGEAKPLLGSVNAWKCEGGGAFSGEMVTVACILDPGYGLQRWVVNGCTAEELADAIDSAIASAKTVPIHDMLMLLLDLALAHGSPGSLDIGRDGGSILRAESLAGGDLIAVRAGDRDNPREALLSRGEANELYDWLSAVLGRHNHKEMSLDHHQPDHRDP